MYNMSIYSEVSFLSITCQMVVENRPAIPFILITESIRLKKISDIKSNL